MSTSTGERGESEARIAIAKLPDFDSLWDYDHPGPTEKRFRKLLPSAVDSLDISYLSELLTQIARAEAMQRKFPEAQKTLDRVEKALRKAEQRVSAAAYAELSKDPRVTRDQNRINRLKELGQVGRPRLSQA